MRICLDNIIFSLQPAGGISVYWYELLRRMLRDGLDFIALEDGAGRANIFRARLGLAPHRIFRSRPGSGRVARYLPVMAPHARRSVFHSSYYRRPLGRGWGTVQTLHDFTYEHYRKGPARWIHSLQKRLALQGAQRVICVSEHTRRDLARFMPRFARDRVRVIYLGCGEAFRPLPAAEPGPAILKDLAAGRYLLYIGSRVPYKNFDLAVEAVSRVAGCALVVIGGGALNECHRTLLETRLAGRYRHLTQLGDETLNAFYNHAHALIYPSTREGFGLPVIEAMAAGCPVIAADASAIPEIAGAAALLVDSPTAEAFGVPIRALENQALRQNLIARGLENAGRFSWERCYRDTIAVYAGAFGRSAGRRRG